MKRIYLFNIVAWNYRKKIGFPVCRKENFAGLQAHRRRGKSARASPTPHHTLNEERSARFTAQPLSALVGLFVETERKMKEDSSEDGNPRNNYLVPYSLRLDKGDMSRWHCKTHYSKGVFEWSYSGMRILRNVILLQISWIVNFWTAGMLYSSLFIISTRFLDFTTQWEPKQVILRAYSLYSYSGIRSLLTFTIHMVWKMTNSVKFHQEALTITPFWLFLQA